MDPLSIVAFLFVVGLGTYVQTVTGFALGLIVMGGITAFDLAPVAFTAMVVTVTAIVNNLMALHRGQHHIDRRATVFTLLGMLPAVYLGLLLLEQLQNSSLHTVRLVLGATILGGGILLALRPHPRPIRSGHTVDALVGVAGGLLAGLFSTGAPPLVFHLYRQPLSLDVIRATLLATFTIATSARLIYVALAGEIELSMLEVSALCMPVVLFATALGKRYPPPLSELAMRRFAFLLLGVIGLSLVVT